MSFRGCRTLFGVTSCGECYLGGRNQSSMVHTLKVLGKDFMTVGCSLRSSYTAQRRDGYRAEIQTYRIFQEGPALEISLYLPRATYSCRATIHKPNYEPLRLLL